MTSSANAEPFLLRRIENDGGRSARMLARRAQRGELVRLAPGTYASTRRWLLLSRQDRRRVTAVAFSVSRRRPVTFCGVTALELLGYPVVEQSPTLHVRAAHRGDSGTIRQVSPYVNDQAVLKLVVEWTDEGLMSSDGTFPMLPAVRQHWNLPGSVAADPSPAEVPDGVLSAVASSTAANSAVASSTAANSAVASSTAANEVAVRLEDGTVLGRVRVDPLPAAMASVFAQEPLSLGTSPADAIKRDHPAAETFAGQARQMLRSAAQRTRFDTQWEFADAQSESAGESISRAIIYELGFVVPDLQYKVLNAVGEVVARTDFYWEAIRLTAEFDGLTKYTGRLARPGADGPVGQDALVREKRREDAVRREGYGMARWIWTDLFNRRQLEALLEQHGVPRRAR